MHFEKENEADVNKLFDQLLKSCRDYIKEKIYAAMKQAVPEQINKLLNKLSGVKTVKYHT